MDKLDNENPAIAEILDGQYSLRTKLLNLSNEIKGLKKEKIAGKERFLRKEVSKNGKHDMSHFDQSLPIPVKPNLLARGAEPTKCSVFTSALAPLRMSFYVENTLEEKKPKNAKPPLYSIMFKNGDDVR